MTITNRTLYFGDNLEILRQKIPNDSFNLIYLDPPFNSKRAYNILFKEGLEESRSQIMAFEDTWHWTRDVQATFDELATQSNERISALILSMQRFLGPNDVLAYLTMMTVRLIELHRVLKSTGSIYLHCDPTASHYLKIVLDTIFGKENFRNEIIWHKNSGGIGRTAFSKRHDVILFYSKSDDYFYDGKGVGELREQTEGTFGGYFGTDESGRRYREVRKAGKVYKYYMDEPRNPEDVWEIPQIPERDTSERLGYPTQKPERLLERILKASSRKGDWVLDPFCGCGTTVAVAERLERQWVGVDISILAINLIRKRLYKQYDHKNISITVDGIPTDEASAHTFFEKDPYQFQMWSVGLINGMAKEQKGADKGIDGIIILQDTDQQHNKMYRKGIIQVKGGHVQRNQVATLKSDVDREKADFGIFITLESPTRSMEEEAVLAGKFEINLNKSVYPKIQIMTIKDLLDGRKPNLPTGLIDQIMPQAQRAKTEEEMTLF